jgi:hypothetical protein
MGLPIRPLPLTVEIAPGGDPIDQDTWDWIDITEFVRYALEGAISVDGGRRDEGDQVDTTNCLITVDNSDGRFSPRNPNGAYYPDLARNTPLRVRYGLDSDEFAAPVVNGWGLTDQGHTWQGFGAGGTVQNSDFQVTGGEGTQSVPVANGFRGQITNDLDCLDVDLSVTMRLTFTDVQGGAIEPAGLIFRFQDVNTYYLARLDIQTNETVNVSIHSTVTGQLGSAVVAGLVHSSAQLIRVRAQINGQNIRIKAWATTDPEPSAWALEVANQEIAVPGGIGIRSGVATGNANTKPIVFAYDDLDVVVDRFVGFVSEWPARWDQSTRDAYVPVHSTGIMRRLTQGAQQLGSTLFRRISSFSPEAYWPLEDEVDTTLSGSPIPGVAPLMVRGFEFGADSELPGSKPLPDTGIGDSYDGRIRPWSSPTAWHVEFVIRMAEANSASQNIIVVHTGGSIVAWQINITSAENFVVTGTDSDGNIVFTNTVAALSFLGPWSRLAIFAEQNGGNIDWSIRWFPIGSDGFIFSSSEAGTIGAVTRLAAGPRGSNDSIKLGHMSVWREANVPYYLFADTGFNGERALTRMQRICDEESVPFYSLGDASESEEMGPQPIGSLFDIVSDCANADTGILFELNGGLAYRPRTSLYNQPVTLPLDMDAFEIGDPFEPTDDDQQITNDVTASRPSGSSARFIDTTSVETEGLYREEVSVNVGFDTLLPNIAAWLVHLGTVDEMRFPIVPLNFARAPQQIEPWLAFRLGGRITIEQTLTQLPGIDIDLLGVGWTENLSEFTWTADINAIPASPYDVGELDDNVLGRLDTDGSTLASSINTVATSLSVATTNANSPLWTTDTLQFPFDIRIDAEVMTVTNITGASSPQTFTVTRSTNGIVASHASGAAVALDQPLILAR